MKRIVSFIKKGKRVSRDCKHISDNFYSYDYYGGDFIYDDNDKVHYRIVNPTRFNNKTICTKCKKQISVTCIPVQKLNNRRKPEEHVETLQMAACHMPMKKGGGMGFSSQGRMTKYILDDLPDLRLEKKMSKK